MRQASLPSLFAALLITSLAFAQEQKRGLTQIAAVNMADSRGPVSIAPGGIFEFKQLKVIVLAIRAVNPNVGAPRYVASIRVQERGATEEKIVAPPMSFNWHGYHVAIPAVHGPEEPGGGGVVLAVATVASLPQCMGKPIGKDSPWPCR